MTPEPIAREEWRKLSPPEQLRRDMNRSRRAGITDAAFVFDSAYKRIKWPHEGWERHYFKELLIEQRDLWVAAFHREPLPELDPFARLPLDSLLAAHQGADQPSVG